jgi:hypothetical protein
VTHVSATVERRTALHQFVNTHCHRNFCLRTFHGSQCKCKESTEAIEHCRCFNVRRRARRSQIASLCLYRACAIKLRLCASLLSAISADYLWHTRMRLHVYSTQSAHWCLLAGSPPHWKKPEKMTVAALIEIHHTVYTLSVFNLQVVTASCSFVSTITEWRSGCRICEEAPPSLLAQLLKALLECCDLARSKGGSVIASMSLRLASCLGMVGALHPSRIRLHQAPPAAIGLDPRELMATIVTHVLRILRTALDLSLVDFCTYVLHKLLRYPFSGASHSLDGCMGALRSKRHHPTQPMRNGNKRCRWC